MLWSKSGTEAPLPDIPAPYYATEARVENQKIVRSGQVLGFACSDSC